jgi:hypothetical protein
MSEEVAVVDNVLSKLGRADETEPHVPSDNVYRYEDDERIGRACARWGIQQLADILDESTRKRFIAEAFKYYEWPELVDEYLAETLPYKVHVEIKETLELDLMVDVLDTIDEEDADFVQTVYAQMRKWFDANTKADQTC